MSKKNWLTWTTVFAFIGLAAALSIVIHSLVTGQGIHSFGLLIGIFMALQLVQERKGLTSRALPVVASVGAVVGFSLLTHGLVTGRGMDGIALGGGILFALLWVIHVLLIQRGSKE